MRRGYIKRYIITDHFGFITDAETGRDSFLHVSVLYKRGLDEKQIAASWGKTVEYESEWKDHSKPSEEVVDLRLLD